MVFRNSADILASLNATVLLMNMISFRRSVGLFGFALAGVLLAPLASAQMTTTTMAPSDPGSFEKRPVRFTFDLRLGYDDNIDASAFNRRESGFVNFQGGLAYTAASPRASLTIGAGAGIVYYFDPGAGRDYDFNVNFNLAYTYKVTPRLTFVASTYDLYQSQPDFFVPGLSGQRSGDYFYSTNRFGFSYQFTKRFSIVAVYNPIFVVYQDEPTRTAQNRVEHYLSTEFRFLLQPTITLVGEYRFGYIDYFDANSDSTANYVLVGLDATLSPRLRLGFRVGAEFRDYRFGSQDSFLGPYAEATASYSYKRNSAISFSLRYGIEQTDVAGSINRSSFRLGMSVNHQFTARIGGYAAIYYTRSDYETLRGTVGATPNFGENVVDLTVGVRYAITRHWSAEVGYTYTTVDSDLAGRGYDRNRIFVGGRLSF